jgi:hypothetical protein
MKKCLLLLIFVMISLAVKTQNLQWFNDLGGLFDAKCIIHDSVGNVYVSGLFRGAHDFDSGPGVYVVNGNTTNDNAFIAKLDPDGHLLWAKAFVSTYESFVSSLALDGAGNVYSTGYFSNTTDFDPGAGTYTLTSNGYLDMFAAKLDPTGNFIWAVSMGGINGDIAQSIAIAPSGNVYVTGSYRNTVDFDPGPGVAQLTTTISSDIFILKLDASGNFIWVKNIGGTSQDDYGNSLAIDYADNVYLTGSSSYLTDFDPGPGTFNLPFNPTGFVVKLDVSGNFMWAKGLGSSGGGQGVAIVVDSVGNAFVANNNLITRFDALGNMNWTKNVAGGYPLNSKVNALALDGKGYIYTSGYFFYDGDFDPGPGIDYQIAQGDGDVFFNKYHVNGNYVWNKTIGGVNGDVGLGITTDRSGNVFVMGFFGTWADFDPGPAIKIKNGWARNIFIAKYNECPTPVDSIKGPSLICEGNSASYSIDPSTGATGYIWSLSSGTTIYKPYDTLSIKVNFNNTPLTIAVTPTNACTNHTTYSLTVAVSACTGLEPLSMANVSGLVLYPNPNKGRFTISSSTHVDLTLTNSLGQVLQTLNVKANEPYSAHFEGLAPGIYFLTGQSSQGAINQKIIITD